ncbi:MAG TPA: hypothetical protein VMW65_13170 [Chloroflexota bacterium]|nr:hypothetical protein [Chloroflexota bacterium]
MDTIHGSRIANLKELRITAPNHGAIRILFVFDPRRVEILLLTPSEKSSRIANVPPLIPHHIPWKTGPARIRELSRGLIVSPIAGCYRRDDGFRAVAWEVLFLLYGGVSYGGKWRCGAEYR